MSTKLIRSIANLTAADRGAILTIGNFDGVHIGHQQLLAQVQTMAAAQQVPSMVMSFEPHAFEYFTQPHVTIPRLTRLREKFTLLAQSQVDSVLIMPFNQKLAEMSASDFATNILGHAIHPKHIIIGDDFRFGYKRAGDFKLLETLGHELGFSVAAMPTVEVDGERVSSTRVRAALAQGNLPLAEKLLGRPYFMLGRVGRGDQRGRQWGFPTANIFLHRALTPVRGVYTVYMHGIQSQPLAGVANVGVRPTVDGTRTLLEVHLLDFNQDIYGRYVKIEFCSKLRDEERFPNLDLLKAQIAKDVNAARDYFKKY